MGHKRGSGLTAEAVATCQGKMPKRRQSGVNPSVPGPMQSEVRAAHEDEGKMPKRRKSGLCDEGVPAGRYEARNAPHTLDRPPVDFKIVIPTMGRWRPVGEVSGEKSGDKPFILAKTLAFLARHSIPVEKVILYVIEEEKAKYRACLSGTPWEEVRIRVGVKGIRNQRNFIVNDNPAGDYIVSFDDDVSDILWKASPGVKHRECLRSLPPGGLQNWIADAFYRLERHQCFLAGLSCSSNPRSMRLDGISTRCGEVNGFVYCFINRHLEELLPVICDSTEDAERSLRYFYKDRRILRYRMYCGATKCYDNAGGLQALFAAEGDSKSVVAQKRKTAERSAANKIHEMFPDLTRQTKSRSLKKTLEISFRSVGGPVIPSTTVALLKEANDQEAKVMPASRSRKAEPTASVAKKARTDQIEEEIEQEEVQPQQEEKEAPQASTDPVDTGEATALSVPAVAADTPLAPDPAAADEREGNDVSREWFLARMCRAARGAVARMRPAQEASARGERPPAPPTPPMPQPESESDNEDPFGVLARLRASPFVPPPAPPTPPLPRAGKEEEEEEEEEYDSSEAGDEDKQLLEALRVMALEDESSQLMSEEDRIAEVVLRSYNGHSEDPMGDAFQASEETHRAETRWRTEEEKILRRTLRLSRRESRSMVAEVAALQEVEDTLIQRATRRSLAETRGVSSKETSAVSQSWSCTMCTLDNAASALVCAICGTAKQRPGAARWACGRCTLLNEMHFTRCQACGGPC